VRQVFPTPKELGQRDPEEAEGGSELAAFLVAAAGPVDFPRQLTFGGQYPRREHSLWQQ